LLSANILHRANDLNRKPRVQAFHDIFCQERSHVRVDNSTLSPD
jgi:hypothetical protein